MDKKTLEIEDIKRILPQRYPFLMIDRVIEASPKKVVAIKNVSVNESYFEGHFPDEKVMPGVLLIEAMAQAGIVLVEHIRPRKKELRRRYYLGAVNKARFFKTIRPGVQLKIEVVSLKLISNLGIIAGKVFVGEEKVAQAELSFSMRETE